MFEQWRNSFAEDSIFRKPLVFEISLVLVFKLVLLILLWHVAFKPLKPVAPPDIDSQLLPTTTLIINTKETNHD